jgi:hypothetical protein
MKNREKKNLTQKNTQKMMKMHSNFYVFIFKKKYLINNSAVSSILYFTTVDIVENISKFGAFQSFWAVFVSFFGFFCPFWRYFCAFFGVFDRILTVFGYF